jgi:hypothetical protein
MNRFLSLVLVTLVLFLSSCSERSEYGKKSDYEKLGAGSTDKTAPTVSSVSPTDNSIYNSPATTIVVTFSETISTSSITTNTSDTTCSGSFQLSSNNFTTCVKMSAIPSASDNITTFTATPAENLSNGTTFKLRITTSAKDTSSNSLVTVYTTNGFTTSPSGSGTIQGTVRYDNNTAAENVSVSFAKSGTTVDDVSTDASGDYSQDNLILGTYNLTYTKSNFNDASLSAHLATDNQTVTANVTLLANTCSAGTVSGTISDAVSGNAVSDVSLSIRSGSNVTSGSTTGITATSATNGTYTLSSMSAGGYTVQTSKTGYISSYFNINVCGNMSNQNTSMSEELNSGTMRIVLHWDNLASNVVSVLDSHLTGPDNASGRFHIYWNASEYYGVGDWEDVDNYYYCTDNYTSTGCTTEEASDNVSLDRDDYNGPPGTETITISKVRSGTYRYSVQDYSNRGLTSPDNLSKSGTTVTVYFNNTATTYNVPNDNGSLWTLFTFDNSSGFNSINQLSDHSNYDTIQ